MTQRYNKLISRKSRVAMGPDVDESRCSGRTTVIRLRTLADAVDSPGKWIEVRDHGSNLSRDGRITAEVMNLAAVLGLRFIERRCVGGVFSIRSNHFTDNPWEIE